MADDDLASQLPKPESSKGKIEKDSSSTFYIKVCGTDATAYDNYVKALQEKGFTVDYFKSSSAFNAKNAAGYSVNIRYDSKGDSIMPFSSSPRTTLRLPARPGTAPRKTTMIRVPATLPPDPAPTTISRPRWTATSR